jgi:transposase
VGIDTHSKFIQVCILCVVHKPDASTAVQRLEHEFATTWTGIKSALRWVLEKLGLLATQDTLRYCIESTGTYHFPILKAWEGVPCVINPHLTGPTRRKTDVLDARLLAHYSITGLWKPSFVPSNEAQVLRVLWAAHRECAMLATRASNRLNNIVLRFGHTFGRRTSMRTAEGEGVLSDLIEGRVPAVPDVAPDGLPAEVRPLVAALLADLRSAQVADRKAIAAAVNYVKARDWPIGSGTLPGQQFLNVLTSVPGVGQITALTWLAEVTDPRRFDDQRQVAAFCGCDPSLKVSASKVTSYTKRQGNLRLHHALSYAARSLMTQANEPLGRWGRAIAGRHKKGGHRKGTAAVGRRIGCMLWHVHRKGEMFS